ncbi:MAG: glucose-6-phosphate isomerase [Prevotellaceae bacterium]|jgi:glucose-6-phosphate isomerase|nr:glucose-6-phosphate isomerase [Prevotellaceae bacterium]
MLHLDISKTLGAVSTAELQALEGKATDALRTLHAGNGKGSDFLGWLNLPSSTSAADIADIQAAAAQLSANAEVVVVIGIGGSYLGAKAVIDALSHTFDALQDKSKRKAPLVLFAGQNIGEDYLFELMEVLQGKSVACIVISKSGTTTEPALAFRIIKNFLEQTYGKGEAKNRIVAITDKSRGALHAMADREGYKTFVIPDNVGGRFSVLTSVGLLPIACAGIDVAALVQGAVEMEKSTGANVPFEQNLAAQYAAVRNALYAKGKKVEVLANFNPKLHFVAEWWKQLYGESEGKDGKGIFPASVDFTTDLHSLGQYVQDGERMLFETVLSVAKTRHRMTVPLDGEDPDGLNFLAGKRVDEVNRMAELGTQLAHVDGGVPNIRIELPDLSERTLGQLIYFFEKACGISGYMLGVNPFDQPGVEAYKKNMFALLGKPGYEKEAEEIRKIRNQKIS